MLFFIISVVLSCYAIRFTIKFLLRSFNSPSFLSKSDSLELSHKYQGNSDVVSDFPEKNKDVVSDLPEKYKDFIQLN